MVTVYSTPYIQITTLLAALKPFAEAAEKQCHSDCSGTLTQSDWERAAQHYNELKDMYTPHDS